MNFNKTVQQKKTELKRKVKGGTVENEKVCVTNVSLARIAYHCVIEYAMELQKSAMKR